MTRRTWSAVVVLVTAASVVVAVSVASRAQSSPSQPVANRPNGDLTVDTSGHYGQSPSGGTCAHWSQLFQNQSDERVVQVTFAAAGALYTTGKRGEPGYRAWHAETPPKADLTVSIAPDQVELVQFMVCTSTPPPRGATSLEIAPPRRLEWLWQNGAPGSKAFPR
jgi:hypothetical protein